MTTATKTRTPSLYEQRLTEQRDNLQARIGALENELNAAKATAASKLGALPAEYAGSLAEKSALAPVQELQAKIDAFTTALERLDEELKEAPAKAQAMRDATTPMHASEARRDEVLAKCCRNLEALEASLFELREANDRSVELLKIAMRAWRAAGGIADEKPRFASCRWPQHLRGTRRGIPFIDIRTRDDESNPIMRADPGPDVVDQFGRLVNEI